jgi:hypothetical protein
MVGEGGAGGNELGIALDVEDDLLKLGAHGVHGFD